MAYAALATAAIILVAAAATQMGGAGHGAGGQNSTPTPLPAATPGPSLEARNGDTVFADYTLTLDNGTVYDTSIESVARAAGLYREGVAYAPLNVTIGAGQVISGFEAALTGMHEGEEKEFTVQPGDGYGEYDAGKIAVMPRDYPTPRMETVNVSDFLAVFPGFNFSEDTSVSLGAWEADIIAVTSSDVMLRHNPEINQSIQTQSWVEQVVGLNDTAITLRRQPILGNQYYVKGADGYPQVAKVVDVQDDYFVLDTNHPLAGHALHFAVKVVGIARQ